MRTETETKTIYVSDDGKRKSYSQSEIEEYEKDQLKEIFNKRTQLGKISPFTTLYDFAKGDLDTFRKFYNGVDTEGVTEFENGGYYIYIQDSDYDQVGENESLYDLRNYEVKVNQKIRWYQNVLNDITNLIKEREEKNFKKKAEEKIFGEKR